MPFTAQELSNIAVATLDFHERGQPLSQVIQDRPLYNDLMANKMSFPGGKENITWRVKGVYSSSLVGYSHDDEQAYVNPANMKEAKAPWYEMAGGIMVTYTELKKNGISVTDTVTGKSTSTHSQAEKVQLANILEDKFEDLTEGTIRSMHEIMWRDGTQDAKVFPGIQSFLVGAPTTGVRFGIDAGQNSWWRNRATLGIDSSTASNQNLVNRLQIEMRQLRRYTKKAKHAMYAGSDLMDAFEKELRSKGNYTLEGWAKTKKIDASIADIAFKGIDIQYEPMLDDLSLAKYLYVVDHNAIKLRPMEGEEWKDHTPARPPEKYVLYKARTWTGALMARQLNSSGVYSIA